MILQHLSKINWKIVITYGIIRWGTIILLINVILPFKETSLIGAMFIYLSCYYTINQMILKKIQKAINDYYGKK